MIKKIGMTLDSVINFIEYVKANSFFKITRYVLYICFWIMLILTAFNYTTVFEWFYKTSNQISDTHHDKLTEYRIKIGPEIDKILQELCIEANGTRSFILEFHNGTNNPAGLPFYYMNMTYEWTDTEKTYSGASEWSELLISRFPLVPKCFSEGLYVGHVNDVEKVDQSLAHKLRAVDVNYLGCIMLYGKNKPIGILGISTGEEPLTTYNEIRTLLYKYSQRVIKLLDGFENL